MECEICYKNTKMKYYYCTTCKKASYVSCFSRIILKNEFFKDNCFKRILLYTCPFCKGENKHHVDINNAINVNIITELLKKGDNIDSDSDIEKYGIAC